MDLAIPPSRSDNAVNLADMCPMTMIAMIRQVPLNRAQLKHATELTMIATTALMRPMQVAAQPITMTAMETVMAMVQIRNAYVPHLAITMSPMQVIVMTPTAMLVQVRVHGSATIVETVTLTMIATAPQPKDTMAAEDVAVGLVAPPTMVGTVEIPRVETTGNGLPVVQPIGSAAIKILRTALKNAARLCHFVWTVLTGTSTPKISQLRVT